jgi:hypothetical protein
MEMWHPWQKKSVSGRSQTGSWMLLYKNFTKKKKIEVEDFKVYYVSEISI